MKFKQEPKGFNGSPKAPRLQREPKGSPVAIIAPSRVGDLGMA